MRSGFPSARNSSELRNDEKRQIKNQSMPPTLLRNLIAEPNKALSIILRNPHHTQDVDIKPINIRTSGLNSAYIADIPNLEVAKQIKNRQYAK